MCWFCTTLLVGLLARVAFVFNSVVNRFTCSWMNDFNSFQKDVWLQKQDTVSRERSDQTNDNQEQVFGSSLAQTHPEQPRWQSTFEGEKQFVENHLKRNHASSFCPAGNPCFKGVLYTHVSVVTPFGWDSTPTPPSPRDPGTRLPVRGCENLQEAKGMCGEL